MEQLSLALLSRRTIGCRKLNASDRNTKRRAAYAKLTPEERKKQVHIDGVTEWITNNREKHYWYNMKCRYGISQEWYESTLRAQGGGCAICGKGPGGSRKHFQVDHDHACCPGRKSCGKCLRGLMCSGCNLFTGFIEKNPGVFEKIKAYLK